jgi:hypothetical protein
MLFFSDEYSRLIVAFAMQAITETPTHLETLVAEFTRAGHHIVHLISDPGTEFSSAFTAVCNKHNILHKPLPTKDKAYLAENAIGIIFRAARVALRHARLSPILWDLAALNSVYTYNRSPHEHHDGQISPIEFFLGRPQPVHHIRVFGCDAFVHRSLDISGIPTAERWLNMGFSRGSDAHLLLNPETRTFCSSTNVIFYESMEARKAVYVHTTNFQLNCVEEMMFTISLFSRMTLRLKIWSTWTRFDLCTSIPMHPRRMIRIRNLMSSTRCFLPLTHYR